MISMPPEAFTHLVDSQVRTMELATSFRGVNRGDRYRESPQICYTGYRNRGRGVTPYCVSGGRGGRGRGMSSGLRNNRRARPSNQLELPDPPAYTLGEASSSSTRRDRRAGNSDHGGGRRGAPRRYEARAIIDKAREEERGAAREAGGVAGSSRWREWDPVSDDDTVTDTNTIAGTEGRYDIQAVGVKPNTSAGLEGLRLEQVERDSDNRMDEGEGGREAEAENGAGVSLNNEQE